MPFLSDTTGQYPPANRVAIELLEASNGWFRFVGESPPAPPQQDASGDDAPPDPVAVGGSHVSTVDARHAAPPAGRFPVDACVMMWAMHDTPSWAGAVQAMTLTGDYRDNLPAIRALFDELSAVHAATEPGCPKLRPGIYSTAMPWEEDDDGGFAERRRLPHESTTEPRPAWTIVVSQAIQACLATVYPFKM
jgi:hypothetical protein